MVNANNPLWNLNELCSNWMFFVIFVGFLSAAGIYQHIQCVKLNSGKRFQDDKDVSGMLIGIYVCAGIAGLLILSGMIQLYYGESLTVT